MNAYYNHSYNRNTRAKEKDGLSFGEFILALFELMLSYIDKAIEFFSAKKTRNVIRVVVTVVCLIGFLGIIGSVEAETLSLGTGIVASIALFTVEILCVR